MINETKLIYNNKSYSCNLTVILCDLLCYFFFCSQVKPSSDNLAASSLSKDVRNRNIRKVETNARVAFVIWIMEFCANICIIIVWAIVYGKTTFATLTTNIIWYYIILPHILLMNTAHNKDLVVDQGWKTTIKNALSLPMPFNMKRSIQDAQQNQCMQNSNDESSGKVFTISNSQENCEEKLESYGISISEQAIFPSSNDTQKQKAKLDSDKSQLPISMRSSSTETTFSENQRLNQGNRLYFGEQILQCMMNSIEVEISYLHYFRELLRLEETLKLDGDTLEEFEIQDLDQLPKVKFEKAKSSKFIHTNHTKNGRYKNNYINKRSKNSKHEHMDPMTNLLFSKSKRIKLRRQTMSNFHLFCASEETYSDFLNILINLEEHFIK